MPAPITVAYVGNFTRPWCTEVHVAASLEQLGCRVDRLQENTLDWRQLPELVDVAGARLLLWTRTWEVNRDDALHALDRLRARGVPTVSYHLDRWWGLAREYQLTSEPFFRTDLVVTPDGGPHPWDDVGIDHAWLPPGVFGPECEPASPNHRAFPHDVVFVGTHPYPHPEWHDYRSVLLDRMRAAFGERFAVWPANKTRPLRGRQLAALYGSAKVVVGDSCLAGGATGYWSDRVPETLGRGAVLVHPFGDVLHAWYPQLPTYPLGDFDTAVARVDELLTMPEHDRRELAGGLRALVLDRDTYAHRMASVLELVEQLPPGRARRSPGRVDAQLQTSRASFAVEDDDGAVAEVWKHDAYELLGCSFAGTVIDVGANVGAFSILAVQLGAAHVHAWEPQLPAAELLALNAKENGVDERVTVHGAALGAVDGTAAMNGAGVSASAILGDGEVQVEGVNEAWRPLGPVELVKIDCEGGEYAIVDALDDDVIDQLQQLVMEYHGPAMPGLAHLDADSRHVERWGAMVAKLAQHGRVNVVGDPRVGGTLRWVHY